MYEMCDSKEKCGQNIIVMQDYAIKQNILETRINFSPSTVLFM